MRADGSVLIQFRETARPRWWPIVNFLYQPYLETTLERLLAAHPAVEVRRGREVVDFTQDEDGVSVVHAAATGSGYGRRENQLDLADQETVRASYLVGADGGRSVVRTGLGIEMSGKSFPERWLVVDLKAKDGGDPFRHLPYFDFVCDAEMPTVSCPQPGGHHRFEFALADTDDSAHFESGATVRALLGRYVDVEEVEVRRSLVYTFNAVTADRWRDGRILLAGDAAHMTPQFIGQGMNAGVRDADNLSWKLHAVLRHGAYPALLDTYESERKPHAKAMIALSVFNKSVVSLKHPLAAKARDAGLWAARHTPVLGGWVERAGMKPKPRYRSGTYVGVPRRPFGAAGTLSPQPSVRRYDGRPVRFDDAVGIGWTVVGLGADPREVLGRHTGQWERVGATFTTVYAPGTRPHGSAGDGRRGAGLVDLEDTTGDFGRWARRHRIRSGDLLVLRPDKFVFGTGRDAAALTAALVDQLGPDQSGRGQSGRGLPGLGQSGLGQLGRGQSGRDEPRTARTPVAAAPGNAAPGNAAPGNVTEGNVTGGERPCLTSTAAACSPGSPESPPRP